MKMKKLIMLYICISLFSCTKNINKKNQQDCNNSVDRIDKNILKHNDTLKSIKKMLNDSKELSQFPDSVYFDTQLDTEMKDSTFIKYFLENNNFYYSNNGIKNNNSDEQISLSGFVEYHFFPQEVYEKYKSKIYNYGKITNKNYLFQFIKYYDVDSSRFYMLIFDLNYKLISSISIYGYQPTFINQDVYNQIDKKSSPSFLNYSKNENKIELFVKGSFINYNYNFIIDEKGKLILTNLKTNKED